MSVMVLLGVATAALELTTESFGAEPPRVTFASPAEAGAALAKAAKAGDENSLADILGVDVKTLLFTGNDGQDDAALQAFAAKYETMNRWVDMSDGSRVLYIGADNFAFPVPLAQNSSGRWYFDGIAGGEEVRARNVGRNELLAIDACNALSYAQQMYFAGRGHLTEYAQRIVSTQGKQDGLYWRVSAKQAPSPLASIEQFPESSVGSLSAGEPFVLDGYTFRILAAQGNDAPGGARKYMVNGKMTDGFAILATPVRYAETGVMTFMVGPHGVVYERDFGPDTTKIAASIQEFNPTEEWSPVE
jgi:hypothetical protein